MNKSLPLLAIILSLVSCATPGELKKAQTCKVWEDQPVIGPFFVDVTKKESYWEGNCRILGFFACSWVRSDYDNGIIHQDSNGIFNSRIKIATLKQSKLAYEKRFTDLVVKVSPMEIDLKQNKVIAHYTLKTPLKNIESKRKIEFNESCTAPEVALGIVTLITAKSKPH